MNPFRAKPLTRGRIAAALAVAAIADGLQFAAGPLGWVGFVQFIDVAAMIITCLLLGFHPLLLPTFVVEFIPVVDMLPTWTGCVGAVILMRKGLSSTAPPANTPPPAQSNPSKPPAGTGPVIDV